MKYEISYLSKSGNTAKLAEAIASMLPPEDTRIADLASGEASGGADISFVGFDVESGTIPLKIMDALDYAEGKTVVLFATCFFAPTEDERALIERKVAPFLPNECDYRGLFLCAGALPENIFASIKKNISTHPNDTEASALLDRYESAIGHPDAQDIENLEEFVQTIFR